MGCGTSDQVIPEGEEGNPPSATASEQQKKAAPEQLKSGSDAKNLGANGTTGDSGTSKQVHAVDPAIVEHEGEHDSEDREFLENLHVNARKGDLLKQVPALQGLSQAERDIVGGTMEELELAPNATIFTQGDPSDGMYCILAGEAAVLRNDPVSGQERELLRLGEGDVFGENGIENANSKRNATVRATESGIRVLFLEREKFLALVRTQVLHVQFAKRKRGVGVRANDGGGGGDQFHAHTRTSMLLENMVTVDKTKTDQEFEFLYNAVRATLLFGALPEDHVKAIVEEMWKGDIKKGTVLIKQGDMGNHVYVLEKGNFDVFIWDEDDEKTGEASDSKTEKKQKKVDYKVPGDVFGDLALMYNAPRNATCTAEKDSVVWMVDRFTFQRIARDVGAERLLAYQAFLAQVHILAKLNSAERMKVAEALEEVEFSDGEIVYAKGSKPDAMYIVVQGEARIEDSGEKISGDNAKVLFSKGDYFGEQALLRKYIQGETTSKDEEGGREHTIRAVGTLWLLRLDTYAFALLIGPLADIMERKSSVDIAEEKVETYELEKIDRNELEHLGILGKGAYGFVSLVSHKDTGKLYALKAVSKQKIVDSSQQVQIINEKQIMAQLNHPFFIKLHATFKDTDMLYFVMEPAMGGELFTHLRKMEYFPENMARFYAGITTVAFGILHKKNILHRDLKLENLLLCTDGYVKLTDFGFAKKVVGRTWTLCGTPVYLAPEIINSQGHGKGVDWWTLGIVLFEMMAGFAPFQDPDQMKMYRKITKGHLRFPYFFSQEARGFIAKLLERKRTKRLGVVGGAERVQQDPFFTNFNFNFEDLKNRKMTPPFLPDNKNETDLRNFANVQDLRIPDPIPYRPNDDPWDENF